MTKTREEFVNRALQKLHVLAAGQAASAEDYALVNNSVVPVLSSLSSRNIYGFGDADQIEEDAYEHLAVILANECATDFGKEFDQGAVTRAERLLREIAAPTLSYQPLRAEYS